MPAEIFKANRILNEEEIRQRKIKLDSFMRSLIITLSSRCNISCIMCEVKTTKWDIPRRTMQEIAAFFPYLENVSWQGGEPFLLEYFEEIFDEAVKFSGLKQTIVTNGTLITESWAEKLVKNKLELTFSIDGLTREVYEHIRAKAKFDDVMRGLSIVRDARQKYPSQNMTLRLHVVVMKSNYHQLEEFMDFAKEYNFSAVHIISLWGNYDSPENIFNHRDKKPLDYLNGIRNKLEEKAKRYNIVLQNSLPCITDSSKDRPVQRGIDNNGLWCRMPWQQLNIDPGGGVRPGCACLKTVGSVLDNDIKDLWNNDSMQEYRKKIIERDCVKLCEPNCLSEQISQQS